MELRQYGTWEEDTTDKTLAAYRYGDTVLDTAAQTYIEPKATVKRRTDGSNINAAGHKQLFGRVADLLEGTENV